MARLRALPQVVRIEVAGSIRRRKEVCKDMDIVASVLRDEDRAPIMRALVESPDVASITGEGDTKTSVVLKMGMAVDLRVVFDNEYPYLLQHFSGSKAHNVALRTYFHPRGIKISEYGIFKGEDLIPCKDEVEIYRALGMQYVEPELREDMGEIQAAREDKLPTLVTEADLRGILHVHSTWSDGGASVHEMAEAARAMGMSYLGMCDHSQLAAYANGLTPARVREQQAEIDRLNDEYAGAFRILKGTECDILKDGALDFDEKTLASFDFVVASIHSHFELPPAEQTQRLIHALENPYLSILGHPTGRILLERNGYNPDLEAVIDRAGELGVCIELNADPHRFDLDWRFHRRATDRGIRIPICPDAHTPGGLRNISYGIGIARKGWLTKADVLNASNTTISWRSSSSNGRSAGHDMLLELAIGDAYGAGFEYVDADTVAAKNDLSGYVRHPRHRIAPGRYTDDTQMSLAVTELIVSGAPWTAQAFAEGFFQAFKRDPREGYSANFSDFLRRVTSGAQFLAEIRPESDKSGAAMRAAPIGVYATTAEVIARATEQAKLTHNTPDGINSAVAAALMSHYFLYRLGPKSELGALSRGTFPVSGRKRGAARSRARVR